jgi:hypothetical protein
MNPSTVIALLAAAGELIQVLTPILSKIIAGGTVTIDDQTRVSAAVNALRKKLDDEDLGDHWKIEG